MKDRYRQRWKFYRQLQSKYGLEQTIHFIVDRGFKKTQAAAQTLQAAVKAGAKVVAQREAIITMGRELERITDAVRYGIHTERDSSAVERIACHYQQVLEGVRKETQG